MPDLFKAGDEFHKKTTSKLEYIVGRYAENESENEKR